MNYNEENIEQQLRLYREALTPSREEAFRVIHTAIDVKKQSIRGRSVFDSIGHYFTYMSSKLKILVPVAAVAIALIILVTKKGPVSMVPSSNTGTVNEIAKEMENDGSYEQAITDESDSDVALAQSDNSQLDAFTSVYSANEY